MAATYELSIIIPTYCESGSIGTLIESLESMSGSSAWEIIISDDDSPDRTQAVVTKLKKRYPNIVLINRKGRERGLGLSIGDGVRYAHGKYVLGMDADGNHDPVYIPKLLSTVQRVQSLVVGSRFVGSARQGGMRDYLPSFFFNSLARLLGMPIWDNTSGYYTFPRRDLKWLPTTWIFRGYGDYHIRLVHAYKTKSFPITEIPIVYGKRMSGESKSRQLFMFWTYLQEIVLLRFRHIDYSQYINDTHA
jgi:dolichol-phosphate mannosyltransferase